MTTDEKAASDVEPQDDKPLQWLASLVDQGAGAEVTSPAIVVQSSSGEIECGDGGGHPSERLAQRPELVQKALTTLQNRLQDHPELSDGNPIGAKSYISNPIDDLSIS
ncbi:hypothetical protein [Rhodoligotrophos defluvii]|uniref:hypothetical protein n=1 Tax=Rhodoligotrophos defluvii TaxID=2561934 RepID=UPI0010CA157E|nr:hypothetical protein [Rhodoligotrophos defluvii]